MFDGKLAGIRVESVAPALLPDGRRFMWAPDPLQMCAAVESIFGIGRKPAPEPCGFIVLTSYTMDELRAMTPDEFNAALESEGGA